MIDKLDTNRRVIIEFKSKEKYPTIFIYDAYRKFHYSLLFSTVQDNAYWLKVAPIELVLWKE